MPKQLEFKKVNGWGGKRRGAGRPNKSGEVGHTKRAKVDFKKPLHITWRLKDKMPNLRNKEFLKQFKEAIVAAREFGLHLNHYALLNNHIHLIAEARNNNSLERGMKSLGSRLGKLIRKTRGGRGSVWAGRFHLHVLKTPTEVRRALHYVLLNPAKHGGLIEHIDDFSSGYGFKEWRRLLGAKLGGFIQEQIETSRYEPVEISAPRSWLLNHGWKRADFITKSKFKLVPT